ncbi:MAG: cupin domain-containing protein [Polyangiaceae bacterium]|nr:cupin domain-containing protein [Polyangiaceae bacterium]
MNDTAPPEGTAPPDDSATLALYGAHYRASGERAVVAAPPSHSYHFTTYLGEYAVTVEAGDCCYFLETGARGRPVARRVRGPATVQSLRWATIVRGFTPPDASIDLDGGTVLPYVNGCSTKQLFPPPRPGDPTLQYLLIPPCSAEQAHHIHATVRVVYVLEGRGVSVVGMERKRAKRVLEPGMLVVLDPMCPHHFETPQGEWLHVVPLHVWSSTPHEPVHPMSVGTHLMNQGG